jgi:phage tail sheath protein FI
MPVAPTYPGVYIEELPSGVRTIVGVATSITAFIGRAVKGPLNEPSRVQSPAEYERQFGGLWSKSTMSYAVRQFFLNGGSDALIVRIHRPQTTVAADTATITLASGSGKSLVLEAASPGAWGNNLSVIVDHDTKDSEKPTNQQDKNLFNLTIQETIDEEVVGSEQFLNASIDPDDVRHVTNVLEQESDLVRVRGSVPNTRPDETKVAGKPAPKTSNKDGDDGLTLQNGDLIGKQLTKEGLYALEKADLFNLLCIPPLEFGKGGDLKASTWSTAAKYCEDRRAMLIVDPPSGWDDIADVEKGVDTVANGRTKNAAVFFPRVKLADPLRENRLEEYAPCGVVAGVFARTDAQRGVWKAPGGIEATLTGVRELSYKMTDGENGRLNPLGINCIRNFRVIGNILWGSRTLVGADRLASQWKYVPVRRLALYIEESLYRGLQWVVFEPNDEPLWAQIRLNVGAFMHDLFRQQAFQGTSPREAYQVKCDKETTTQSDINKGIVNILVGFAPLKPAEFVIVKIKQLAGQVQT